MKNMILGVTGSIAAYKAADLAHRFYKQGYQVEVILTNGATKFVTPLTFRSLTQNRVYTDVFQDDFPQEIKHISLATKADVVLIAPATANIIGKIAFGIGDDMLSTTILAVRNKPVLIAPAMNTNMWENPIVQENISKLKKYGYQFIEPKESLLACGTLGKGALAELDDICSAVNAAVGR
ncbi:bifunctional phosphopantothenoylcysteine decarboxylase/phosphopantothenate--cysteine ligase CoaBC [Caproiciproducens sp. CPB-2]|uniref:bifunctional phosphopantothenoylcysteine decarboxylase/phosphopantothenate--cysteine ligase CoaBC n=1 Tax=Caproiciproducens sp. CPB-2 TaxID=3030017 RepID=UPI0023DA5B2F|nr:bifunctional phosphopantothenoylcysteine decarboxylase/phosphopantothenate--cysteine ligase CoaBC [Caproiciproducens sp. CPB-2]MDF1493472.1 bifunctional phosphopantothenoylcysteine decarboxylase/phosphopantothenate--cysteine ligase CoaBC [Caproiciproducens sp. CPB-2]